LGAYLYHLVDGREDVGSNCLIVRIALSNVGKGNGMVVQGYVLIEHVV
jgi:hypothetical protein